MPESSEPLASPSEKLILIIDDDESFAELLELIVGKEGFKTVLAGDGEEGLKKIEAEQPDLILLDMMLPGKAGYEVLRDLQATDAAQTPVIVMTGRTIDRKNVEMIRREINVKEFMHKPLRPAILAATLHRILLTRPPAINRADRGPMSGGVF